MSKMATQETVLSDLSNESEMHIGAADVHTFTFSESTPGQRVYGSPRAYLIGGTFVTKLDTRKDILSQLLELKDEAPIVTFESDNEMMDHLHRK